MKKLSIIGVVVLIFSGGWYLFTDSNSTQKVQEGGSNPLNTTYVIDGRPYALKDGLSEEAIPASTSKVVTRYFGNEVRTDLNDDGREDALFLITQETGGTGIFFYVVAALNTEDGWRGSHGLFLGDRIAPQTTALSLDPSHKNIIVVNYADRNPDEPMSAQPSIGKSMWLELDLETLQFGEVVRN